MVYGGAIEKIPDAAKAGAKLWPTLAEAAGECERVTYGFGHHLTGYPLRLMGDPCWLIMLYCRGKGVAPLNVLVVHATAPYMPGNGYPGQYYGDDSEAYGLHMKWAWMTNWTKIPAPKAQDLMEALDWFYDNDPVTAATDPVVTPRALEALKKAPDPCTKSRGLIRHFSESEGPISLDPRASRRW